MISQHFIVSRNICYGNTCYLSIIAETFLILFTRTYQPFTISQTSVTAIICNLPAIKHFNLTNYLDCYENSVNLSIIAETEGHFNLTRVGMKLLSCSVKMSKISIIYQLFIKHFTFLYTRTFQSDLVGYEAFELFC